jgi:ATP-dependent DNA helicase PIF1
LTLSALRCMPQAMSGTTDQASRTEYETTDEHRRAENLFHRTNRNFLVLGSAGTGKSCLLRRLVETSRKKVAVVAYTGLAAIQAGGRTVNSVFGLAPKLQPRHDLQETPAAEERYQRFRDLEALLIDEVSMLRADLFDAVETMLREHGPRPGEMFGGVQVGLFGDPLQLPPIVSANELQAFNGNWQEGWPSPWFCDAFAYRTGGFVRVTLQRIFRQTGDDSFAGFLARLREGRMQSDDFEFINSRVTETKPKDAASLVTTNAIANWENESRYNALPGPAPKWTAEAENWPDFWEGDEPVPRSVAVKAGARVIVCANRAGPGLVNGSVGTVSRIDDEAVYLRIKGEEVPVRRYTWEFPIWDWDAQTRRMFKKGTARYTQMPLKLAWALTIHKAQGQTIDGPVWVDLGNRVWSGGQTYVALSRVRRLEQLHLRRPVRNEDVLVEKRALDFLSEGDTPSALEEIRAMASEVYRQTRRLRDSVEAKRQAIVTERAELRRLLEEAKATLSAVGRAVEESRQLAAHLADIERNVTKALDRARKATWLRRLLGHF